MATRHIVIRMIKTCTTVTVSYLVCELILRQHCTWPGKEHDQRFCPFSIQPKIMTQCDQVPDLS